MMFVCTNTYEFSNPNELEDKGQCVLHHNRGLHDARLHTRAISQNFKTLTNFIAVDLDELCGFVVPIIASRARSTGKVHKVSGCHTKLCLQQCLLEFLLCMKYEDVTSYNAFQ